MDHSVHLLPAGLSAVTGEVVPWQPRRKGQVMRGVTLALEGRKEFKVRMIEERRERDWDRGEREWVEYEDYGIFIFICRNFGWP